MGTRRKYQGYRIGDEVVFKDLTESNDKKIFTGKVEGFTIPSTHPFRVRDDEGHMWDLHPAELRHVVRSGRLMT